MAKYKMDYDKYAALARQAVAESCVLLKNEDNALPLRSGEHVAVFGRGAFNYYKSGVGSGGLVSTRYVVGILDALLGCKEITVEEKVLDIYREWIKENPFDEGKGWGLVPHSQKEMPLTEEVLAAGKDADVAVVVIARTSGEDQDNENAEGSYLLTEVEKDMILKVSAKFPRTVVLINTGYIIDMEWMDESNPSAVMYVWQGGQEGGNGVLDVLMGDVTPCGKLTDTIARSIEDYPSTANFGDDVKNYYEEDIFVGYRYFETFAKEKVRYPFGYGLSYTTFLTTGAVTKVGKDTITVKAKVMNTGDVAGKEVVQVYVKAPFGKLGKAVRVLTGYAKTGVLQPGEIQELDIEFPVSYAASFDDSGVTGHKSCFVLEAGDYEVYIGNDVRHAISCGSWKEDERVLEQVSEACAPTEPLNRMKAVQGVNGVVRFEKETAPMRIVDASKRQVDMQEADLALTGDRGYLLGDVLDGKITMDQFVAQLSEDDLVHLFHGEGMCSPKVTPGTAGAFGGLTQRLKDFGIPAACCSDGPSGIRMDCGTIAFSLPNGTALGCTYNDAIVKELFTMLGLELRKNKIDTILGPGINIHRSPLNGRNFEYVSEDPVLTGRMCVAQLEGMACYGVTGTIKHFCANNQEHNRYSTDSVISERALREIYLKGFEIAVREGKAKSIMTTYGALNGVWTAGNFDLNTVILRKEWGYEGIVMTDWWAVANNEGEEPFKENRAPMVAAQNDLFMVCPDAIEESEKDNVKEMLAKGEISLYDLQRNAKNILKFIMESPAMLRMLGRIEENEFEQTEEEADDLLPEDMNYYDADPKTEHIVIDEKVTECGLGKKHVFACTVEKEGPYRMTLGIRSDLEELAQLPISVYMDNIYRTTISFQGTKGAYVEKDAAIGNMQGRNHYIKLVFGANGIELDHIDIYPETEN